MHIDITPNNGIDQAITEIVELGGTLKKDPSLYPALLLEVCARTTGRQARGSAGAVDILRDGEILDGSEAQLLKGLVGVSNDRGAHQGLTDGEETLFRLHFTTAAFRYLLARSANRTGPGSS